MPSKGKRIASRQNNLRRRRSAVNRGSNVPDARATAVAEPESAAAEPPAAPSAVASVAPAGVSRAVGRPETQPRGRRFDRPAAYNHVGSEITRIGIFAGVLLVALIAVSFVV